MVVANGGGLIIVNYGDPDAVWGQRWETKLEDKYRDQERVKWELNHHCLYLRSTMAVKT